jgi:hypothetical protein
MSTIQKDNWKAIVELVAELKRCDENGLITASVAMSFICIDTLANLSRAADKPKVTRSDFKEWVNLYLIAHDSQPYQYRGKDVYAARCAFLHTYGSEAELHESDPDTIKFAYHDGGKHQYNPEVEPSLVLIGVKSFVNDVVIGVSNFIEGCQNDSDLKQRVASRLPNVLDTVPFSS